jgi:hypothetical protein
MNDALAEIPKLHGEGFEWFGKGLDHGHFPGSFRSVSAG